MIQRVEAGRELGKQSLSELGKALPELIAQRVTAIHLDTSKVVEFDSESLEAVLEFDALARSRGLSVAVLDPSELLGMALRVTGLLRRLDVRMTAGAAGDAGRRDEPSEAPSEAPPEPRPPAAGSPEPVA